MDKTHFVRTHGAAIRAGGSGTLGNERYAFFLRPRRFGKDVLALHADSNRTPTFIKSCLDKSCLDKSRLEDSGCASRGSA